MSSKRISELAKELGVTSKAILDKLKAEDLTHAGKPYTASNTIGIGLQDTIRQWFSEGEVQTAVETAEHVDVQKIRAKLKKKASSAGEFAPATEEPFPSASSVAGEETATAVLEEAPPSTAGGEEFAPEEAVEPEPGESHAPAIAEPPPAPTEEQIRAQRRKEELERRAEELRRRREEEIARIVPAPLNVPTAPQVVDLAPRGEQLVVQQARLRGPQVIRVEAPEILPPPRPRTLDRRPPLGGGRGGRPGVPPVSMPPVITPSKGRPGKEKTAAQLDEEERMKARSPRRSARGHDTNENAIKEWSQRDLEERRDRLAEAGFGVGPKRKIVKPTGPTGQGTLARKTVASVTEPIILKEFCTAIGIGFGEVSKKLLAEHNTLATINQPISADVAELLALSFGVKLNVERAKTLADRVAEEFANRPRVHLQSRPPVITILGHVDHGKTSLLDRIRQARVAAGEAGGITQHIGAYMYDKDDIRVTFLDTPGHKAFTEMRARGANMTDVVVLVVAADDGVQPQTVESINHAKAAGVPIIVALNKIDKPDANEQRVLGQLAEHGLQTTAWGGPTEVVKTSAVSGEGLKELLDLLNLQAQILELKADPTLPATGMVVEARLDENQGNTATLLVREGTLKVGDTITAGCGAGRARSLRDDLGRAIKSVTPGMPVVVSGWDQLPVAGDRFYVVENIARANELAEESRKIRREANLAGVQKPLTLENWFDSAKEAQVKELRIILKCDVTGSLEVLKKEIADLSATEVKVRILHAAVGGISESDVALAEASGAIVIGFSVTADSAALSLAEQRQVEIRLYRVIYEITTDIRKAMEGLLEPERKEERLGRAVVQQVFRISKVGLVAGSRVTEGVFTRNGKYRLIRGGVVVRENMGLDSLKRVKEDVREVKSGFECGVRFAGFDDVKEGDMIEAYQIVETKRTLE